ncbi:hypothetical protein D3C81_2253440 [compost metagenome]
MTASFAVPIMAAKAAKAETMPTRNGAIGFRNVPTVLPMLTRNVMTRATTADAVCMAEEICGIIASTRSMS